MTPSPFQWSCSRMRLFEFCERAYFLRYLAEQNDIQPSAGTAARPLVFYRKMTTVSAWVRGLLLSALEATLSEAALRQAHATVNDLRRTAMRFAVRDTWALRRQSWRAEPKSLCIKELYYGTTATNEVAREGERWLSHLVDGLAHGGVFDEFASLPFTLLKPVAKPETFFFEGVDVWTAPDFSWPDGRDRRIACLHLGGGADDARWAMRMGVNTLGRITRYGDAESRIVCSTVLLTGDSALPVYARTCRGETEQTLRAGIEAALLKHRSYESEGPSAFTPAASTEKCPPCAFKEICGRTNGCATKP